MRAHVDVSGSGQWCTHRAVPSCLLVSGRRPCPKERGDPLLKEQGDLLWKEVRSSTLNTHKLELFWTDRESKSSQNVRPTRRPTSRHLKVIWRRARAQQSVLSLLLSPPSSLLPLPSSKKRGNCLLQEYFRRGIYFYYSFKLIPKNRRRVKLQSSQFYINSKTIGLQRVETVIISAQMVFSRQLGYVF